MTEFLKKEFEGSEVLDDLCNDLLLKVPITPFLVITKVNDVNEYKLKLNEFITNLKQFMSLAEGPF